MPTQIINPGVPIFSEFRKSDGWPFCPRCEDDELYSMLGIAGVYTERRVYLHVLSGMRCYRCGWSLLPGMLIPDVERIESLWPGSIRPISPMPSSPAGTAA